MPARFDPAGILEAAAAFRAPVAVVADPEGHRGVAPAPCAGALATLPAIYPEWLGDRGFTEAHGVRFPYVGGAMANGIASVELVAALADAGCLAFFGAAGLGPDRVEASVRALQARLGERPFGANLIHSPDEPALEQAVADLYRRLGVRRVSAAAYMRLTPALVGLTAGALRALPDGGIARDVHVFAKVSRPEVARLFVEPPPAAMLAALRDRGAITEAQARMAATLPVAEDITAESDSGGHTDNRPLAALLPALAALRDAAQPRYPRAIRVGAAGGLGTPAAVAAAFALGAAYVLVGSVHQGCVESGLSPAGRALLAQADLADVAMAPAADMFELGVEVQVLRRGTLFAARARTLYELWRAHGAWEAIPAADRTRVEGQILLEPFEAAWASTRAYWATRDPAVAARAEVDPRHRCALVFRAYLGQASRWAITGHERVADYQIWCGPAMGAFNRWVAGSPLEPVEARSVRQVAWNLLEGAAQVTRAGQLRACGVPVPAAAFQPPARWI